MSNRSAVRVLACLVAASTCVACARPDHLESARALAGSDLVAPFEFFCGFGSARGNSSTAPALEPVRLFDNLYAAGNSETVVFAITTSDGIILLDSGYADRVESVLVPGLIELGLNPSDVKYVLLGHGHGDHFGGAAHFQEKYGARIGTTAADWDLIEAAASKPDSPVPPRRDLVLNESEPVTLGDTSVTAVAIPGHTAGSLAYIFPVTDGGTPHMAGLFGGTILVQDLITTAGLQQYVSSIEHFLERAVQMGVDVEVQNHPIFDDTPERLASLAAREPGDSHPFVMGTDRYVRFWSVIAECIQAEIVRRGDAE